MFFNNRITWFMVFKQFYIFIAMEHVCALLASVWCVMAKSFAVFSGDWKVFKRTVQTNLSSFWLVFIIQIHYVTCLCVNIARRTNILIYFVVIVLNTETLRPPYVVVFYVIYLIIVKFTLLFIAYKSMELIQFRNHKQ